MAKRGGRQVFLGVQWDSGSWENLPPLCELLIDRVGKRPLVWNFPAPAPASPRKTLAWVHKTISPRLSLDLIAPMGFAGACHPVLTQDELEKELAWALENPWGTGVSQLLEASPSVLMPRVPDLQRPAALKIYGKHRFRTLGIPCGRELLWFAGADLDCFTYSRIRVADAIRPGQGVRPTLADLSRTGDVLLVLDLSGKADRQTLAAVFEQGIMPWLAPEGQACPLKAGPAAAQDMGSFPADGIDWSAFPDPELRQAISRHAGRAKKKRKKSEEYVELLTQLSLAPAPLPEETAAMPGDGAQLVAQMLGEVALAGNGFEVKLAGGRFTGIVRAGRECLPTRPARSYLRVGGRTLHFRTMNSLSFEGDGIIGLREVLVIDSMEGTSLTIEYSFGEGSPLLSITADVRWPALAPGLMVEEHAPLVLSLRELGRSDEAVVECTAPDGSAFSPRIGEGRWTVVPGALYRVALDGDIALLLRPGPGAAWGLTSFRVAREGGRRFLEANPFGGWASLRAAAVSGRRERSSLLVGLEDRRA